MLEIPEDHDPFDRAQRRDHGLWGYWSKTPFATLLWVTVIVWCIGTIPRAISAWPAGAPRLPSGADDVPRASLVKRAGTIVAVSPASELPGDLVIGAAWYDYRLRPDFEQQCVTITGTGVAISDLPAARAAYVKFLGTQADPYWSGTAAALTPGDQTNKLSLQGRRMAQTVLALLALPLAIRSLAWMVPIIKVVLQPLELIPSPDPIDRERRRRRRKLAAGKCPGCGYAIIGLPRRQCPECSMTWTEAELSN